MCGICGYINLDKTKRPSEDVLKCMMAALTHRGPDDEGTYLKDNVALGHRRLSIIDLATGHQPISNEDRSLIIVYNGEVYNFPEIKSNLIKKGHRFSTHSDTEVVLHAYEEYGEDCLKLFNGMFAFAIWDSRQEKLFLARDRFGKKPLYYAIFDNQFIFASELKAILKHPSVRREIDLDALSKYLAYEYVPSPLTIFKGIKKMPAGSKLSLKKGVLGDAECYWDAPLKKRAGYGVEEAKSQLLQLLKESVRRRLISDVPLGVFLSGGIDSSAVVAMMAELMDPKAVKTFSIGFKESGYDESRDARRVAEYFGTDHHEEILGPGAMLEVLPDICDMLDEPFADSSIIPTYLVSRFTRKHVKVALGGDGGDELFLGYPSFLAHKIESYLNILPGGISRASVRVLAKIAQGSNNYIRRFAKGLDYPEDVRHQVWIGSLAPDDQKGLFLANMGVDYDSLKAYDPTSSLFRKIPKGDLLNAYMHIHIKTYMTDDILTKVDRASMANSLEVRAPFLDTQFAEFAMNLPSSLKLKNFKAKWILKEALKKKLPKETLDKPKHGFAVPVAKWLKEDLKGLLRDAFDRSKIEREGIFNFDYINNMVNEFNKGNSGVHKALWAIFMFETWYDRWM